MLMNGVLFQEKATLLCICYTPVTTLSPNSLWIKGPQLFYKNEFVSFESEKPSIGSESTNLISHLNDYCKPSYLSFIKENAQFV